ncbi:D-aminoacyl-tRNA deacylase 1 isoform X2 [Pseudophryne corroboree]|uniref:D-aminoacyl-tRNA deacylase 1 isoform X2 n=1 Tax=Pseudophryne corroboree TaxID=495146 RepID=UPI0030814B7E
MLGVGEEQISSIGRGICVLLGISVEDTQKDIDYMIRKILNLRIFEDDSGKHWSKSVMDKQYEVLCVSQFTLQCVLKGNKPDYHLAMPSEQAEPFYNDFLQQMRKAYKPELVKDGKFGAYMQVTIQNDGPVTIELEPPVSSMDPKHVPRNTNRNKAPRSLQSLKNSNKEKKKQEPRPPLSLAARGVYLAVRMTPTQAVVQREMCPLKESPKGVWCQDPPPPTWKTFR